MKHRGNESDYSTIELKPALVNFFRNSSPVRIVFLLLLLLLIRIPVITVLGLPLTTQELNWMLVGERMHQGFFLYTGIWDSISPLSAVVYWLIDWQLGRSLLAYHILALVVTALQVVLFNHITNKNQLFPENSSLPGLVYLVLMNISFDFFTLSPVLLSMTFVLLALDRLYIQIDQRVKNDTVFEAGFYLSIAALFHLPTGILIVFALLSLLFFGSSDFRQYFLLIFGFTFPLGLTLLIFYLIGNYEGFIQQFTSTLFTLDRQYFLDLRGLVLILLLPTTLALLGISKVVGSMRYINYQKRCQQIMVVYLIFAVLYVIITPQLSPVQFMLTIPGVAFFAPPYFFHLERKWIAEVSFVVLSAFTLLLLFSSLLPTLPTYQLVGLDRLKVKSSVLRQPIRNKRVLVLGEGIGEYQYNQAATPYLNWQLAKDELLDLNNYQSVVNIYHNFEKDLPDVIIDREQVAEKLFARIPVLARRYESRQEKGVYWRKR